MEVKELFSKKCVEENGRKHLGIWAIDTVLSSQKNINCTHLKNISVPLPQIILSRTCPLVNMI